MSLEQRREEEEYDKRNSETFGGSSSSWTFSTTNPIEDFKLTMKQRHERESMKRIKEEKRMEILSGKYSNLSDCERGEMLAKLEQEYPSSSDEEIEEKDIKELVRRVEEEKTDLILNNGDNMISNGFRELEYEDDDDDNEIKLMRDLEYNIEHESNVDDSEEYGIHLMRDLEDEVEKSKQVYDYVIPQKNMNNNLMTKLDFELPKKNESYGNMGNREFNGSQRQYESPHKRNTSLMGRREYLTPQKNDMMGDRQYGRSVQKNSSLIRNGEFGKYGLPHNTNNSLLKDLDFDMPKSSNSNSMRNSQYRSPQMRNSQMESPESVVIRKTQYDIPQRSDSMLMGKTQYNSPHDDMYMRNDRRKSPYVERNDRTNQFYYESHQRNDNNMLNQRNVNNGRSMRAQSQQYNSTENIVRSRNRVDNFREQRFKMTQRIDDFSSRKQQYGILQQRNDNFTMNNPPQFQQLRQQERNVPMNRKLRYDNKPLQFQQITNVNESRNDYQYNNPHQRSRYEGNHQQRNYNNANSGISRNEQYVMQPRYQNGNFNYPNSNRNGYERHNNNPQYSNVPKKSHYDMNQKRYPNRNYNNHQKQQGEVYYMKKVNRDYHNRNRNSHQQIIMLDKKRNNPKPIFRVMQKPKKIRPKERYIVIMKDRVKEEEEEDYNENEEHEEEEEEEEEEEGKGEEEEGESEYETETESEEENEEGVLSESQKLEKMKKKKEKRELNKQRKKQLYNTYMKRLTQKFPYSRITKDSFKKRSKWMSKSLLRNTARSQMQDLKMENPFMDDYYFTRVMIKRNQQLPYRCLENCMESLMKQQKPDEKKEENEDKLGKVPKQNTTFPKKYLDNENFKPLSEHQKTKGVKRVMRLYEDKKIDIIIENTLTLLIFIEEFNNCCGLLNSKEYVTKNMEKVKRFDLKQFSQFCKTIMKFFDLDDPNKRILKLVLDEKKGRVAVVKCLITFTEAFLDELIYALYLISGDVLNYPMVLDGFRSGLMRLLSSQLTNEADILREIMNNLGKNNGSEILMDSLRCETVFLIMDSYLKNANVHNNLDWDRLFVDFFNYSEESFKNIFENSDITMLKEKLKSLLQSCINVNQLPIDDIRQRYFELVKLDIQKEYYEDETENYSSKDLEESFFKEQERRIQEEINRKKNNDILKLRKSPDVDFDLV